nr:flagellar hook-length control protein FliK [Aestuariivirga litoralis]
MQVKAEAVASASHVAADSASPVTQIVERILQELPAQRVAADTSQVAQASKVLTVRLHPEGLGNVLVKISNSGGALKISLASEQKTTGDQLESDSTQLLQALQQVMPAFKSDSLSFSTQDQGPKDNPQTSGNQSSANQSGAGSNANPGQSNGSEGQNDSGRQAPNAQTYGMPRRRSGETANSTDAGGGQRSGSIYL